MVVDDAYCGAMIDVFGCVRVTALAAPPRLRRGRGDVESVPVLTRLHQAHVDTGVPIGERRSSAACNILGLKVLLADEAGCLRLNGDGDLTITLPTVV